MLGVWPIIMGITMWFQMKLNPTPPDPTQKMIFDWMPLIFTFMLAVVPGGSGDLLGLEQPAVGAAAELHHAPNGVKVELFDNLKATFAPKPKKAESKT